MDLGTSSSANNRSDHGFRSPTMRESISATGPGWEGKNIEEPDTCRICRGEGTEEEELFYPCKCNGSIKFVHQSCLMEWLSHSQKKHCELCKTQFRFTKLYDPNMPQQLPAPLFMRELISHIGRSLIIWLRFLLVAFVWLGWLPWSMRAVWRGLFWLTDGRWPNFKDIQTTGSNAGNGFLDKLATEGISAVPNVFSQSCPATASLSHTIQTAIPQFLLPVSSSLNFTAGEPLIYSIAKRILANAIVLAGTPADIGDTTGSTAQAVRQPSWLSGVEFLNKLTPYPTINNILIDTLEGQLITLLVVILFIHVFLIREWVIQQQPLLNANENADNGPRVPDPNPIPNEPAPVQNENPVNRDAAIRQPADRDAIRPSENAHLDQEANPDTHPSNAGAPSPLIWDHPTHGRIEIPMQRPAQRHEPSLPVTARSSPGPGPNRFAGRDWSFEPGNLADIPPLPGLHSSQQEPSSAQPSNDDSTPNPERAVTGSSQQLTDPISPSRSRGSPEADSQSSVYRFRESNSSPQLENEGPSQVTYSSFPSPGSQIDHSFAFAPESERLASPIFGESRNTSTNRFDFRANVEMPELPSTARENSRSALLLDTLPTETVEAAAPLQDGPVDTVDDSPGGSEVPAADAPAPEPRRLHERIIAWFWEGIPTPPRQEDEGHDEERILEDLDQEPQFVPVRHDQLLVEAGDNLELAERAAPPNNAVDNDLDDIDDGDDLEGILELIGMQGAIFGLLQNGVFSALLISLTVTLGIWIPYLWGKIALVLLTNPIRLLIGIPFAFLSILADLAVDTVIGSFAYLVYVGNVIIRTLLAQIGKAIPLLASLSASNAVTHASLTLMDGSSQRLKRVVTAFFSFGRSDVPMFSVLAHQALRLHQSRIAAIYHLLFAAIKAIIYDIPISILEQDSNKPLLERISFTNMAQCIYTTAKSFVSFLYNFVAHGKITEPSFTGNDSFSATMTTDLAYWDTKDRIIAIILGYCLVSLIGLAYLRLSAYFSGEQHGQRVNGAVAEVLHQAGGVMKVVLIIGIEMIVFPLYCGILLDIALLPLFEKTTLATRIEFSSDSPFTSLFVHWFVGTCYMFHFALFVSMCRKIMRNGVLYFIRDPDDPTFHPVRDVLERNVSTQLRKIAFSAMVYGALVVICMGGVVWGLSLTLRGVLPLRWSSKEPVLEFPVDLLFYNLAMPLAIKTLKPSDILHKMYDWWFHKCARFLRLSHFLFDQRRRDEEGYFVNRTWLDMLLVKKSCILEPTEGADQDIDELSDAKDFVKDGRFVRTPASDQVRLSKGTKVFLEVNENNERTDGEPDRDDGLHGKKNNMFTKVYVPPMFKTRIAAFLVLIWVFAATTGICATILPLVLGRRFIALIFPENVRVNDIYAFSTGLYFLAGMLYAIYHFHQWTASLKTQLQGFSGPSSFFQKVVTMITLVFNLTYTFGAFGLVIPSLFGIIAELYFFLPIHTFFNSRDIHVIHFVQDWTLGVLYTRMAARIMLRNETSRPALALKAIVRNGWYHPDIKFATRAFLLPAILATMGAVFAPVLMGFIINTIVFRGASAAVHSQVYRYSYPGFLFLIIMGWALYFLRRLINIWRLNIRDDVYLIGERLHNFGEKRARDVGVTRPMIT